ncbi:hypothetical protein Q5762_24610 [Streptomyces sp. P9(2023)]|uniref:golvesin C-terminal-like domain-containing protein n=1 Tax=Streptomyces sp. P9(2023) TaxID=3064394 RepID=UPI0028F3FD90|nr:hypothetical protein [Streptomyces sp. P9(2023)]MDT9691465.1 hypothetical protein [Streptomyces sp. P9(2023)]
MPVTVTMATALAIPLSLPAQAAEPTPPKSAAQGWKNQPETTIAKPSAIPAKDRAKTLGAQYKASRDTAFTTSGDGAGFHLLVADEANGYGWKTAATLREDGFDADAWIGNACLTSSGEYAAVAYAPRTFTNRPELMVRGAFTAVVNLGTGQVTKLPFTASLAYFSPGCGDGEQVVFTQLTHDGDKKQQTRLITVGAKTGKQSKSATFPGQVTSAIPTKNGIVAAHGNRLVRLNGAKETELVRTRTVPFQLTADADGGVTFIDRELDKKASIEPRSWAQYLTPAKTRGGRTAAATVAGGKLEAWDLTRTASGRVVITGKADSKGKLPARIANPGGLDKGARMSSLGRAAVSTTWADGKTSLITQEEGSAVRSARMQLKLLTTGKTVTLDAKPAANGKNSATGIRTSPVLSGGAKAGSGATGMSAQSMGVQALSASPTGPSEGTDERYCAVARNDVKKQAFQPTPRQVEWAVDQAVVGKLDFYRSPDWKNTGTGGYQPQGLFPPLVLEGDPNGTLDTEDGTNDKWHVPAQILLGITAQESNMWQATRFAVPGVTANSLIGNYYGTQYTSDGTQADPWRINWSEADCGYGITQATDGMRLPGKEKEGETALSTLTQEAVALDYTANIAYGARILSDKWNQTRRAGMKINDGHPKWIENWFYALWAYNSGFYETPDSAGHRGVGWTNNPANPLWKANRVPFLQNALDASKDDYSHAAHPQDWPYQEKVIGWAGRPISAMFAPGDFQAGYRPAWWNTVIDRVTSKPPVDTFCDASNDCDPSKISDTDSNDPGLGACKLDSGDSDTNPNWLHCWWGQSAQWKDCGQAAECGYAVHRFNTSYPEQPDGTAYPPRCTNTDIPSNALIIDDVPNGTVPAGSDTRGCGPVKSAGTFNLTYQPSDIIDAETGATITTYPGKIDTHQIGAAYGNHFWFTHTRSPETFPAPGDRMKVTGTWRLGSQITTHNGQAKVFAHIPDHGAQTGAATYRITTQDGVEEVTISQKANQSNKWVDLGAYFFNGVTPEVSLDNFNGGDGSANIAFDAIAFAPGVWNGMNMGTFPSPNPNAPEPADVEPPSSISDRFFSLGVAGSAATTFQTTDAASTARATGAASTTAASSAATSTGDTVSCSIVEMSMTYTRTDACVVDEVYINQPATQTTPAKQAKFDYRHEIDVDPRTNVITQRVTIGLDSMTNATRASFDVNFDCRGYCVLGPKTTTSGSGTFNKGDTSLYQLEQKTTWNGTGTDVIVPHWSFSGSLDSVPTKSTLTAEKDELTIRCDNVVVNAGTGCVFSYYKPTYVLNSKKFPGAAAHIAFMWKKTKITYGNKNGGKPLTYLADKLADDGSGKPQKDRNRAKICGSTFKKFQGTGDFSDLWGKTDGISCDEFVFANAYQSAGTPISNGGTNPVTKNGHECIQTYIKRNADGTSSIHLRPDAPLPTYNEPCGRSSMSTWQNTQSMQPFGAFIGRQRLHQDDNYWVDLDGFVLP